MQKAVERKSRILVVDDEAPNRRLLQRALLPRYEVVEADSGSVALEIAQTEKIDLVLLDVVMPGQDGFETCRLIKAQPRSVFLPVVLVTGLGEQEHRNKGLEAGADDFLHKPVDRRELLLRVRSFLRIREQETLIRAQVEELRRLQALKDDLVSLLVHDLRNPLSGVISSLELAVETPKHEQQEGDLRRALQCAGSLRSALDEMLQVRLLEENAVTARRAQTDLQALIGAAIATLEPVAKRRKVQVRAVVEGDASAPLDARLTQRSVENLLSNALKYTPAGSEIVVAARNRAGEVELSVSDRGAGIPDALKATIFQRFGSVEAQQGKQRRGIGLGLYLVKLVANAHGGDVSVHDAPGGGALFRMRLAAPGRPDFVDAA